MPIHTHESFRGVAVESTGTPRKVGGLARKRFENGAHPGGRRCVWAVAIPLIAVWLFDLEARASSPSASTATASTAAATRTSSLAEAQRLLAGEITHAGAVRLVPKSSFIGVRMGVLIRDTLLFLSVGPKADLLLFGGRLQIGIEVPLNIEIYSGRLAADGGDTKKGFADLGKLRKEDYDEKRDFVKILRYFSFGRRDEPFFFSVSQLSATTLGHGLAMRRYAANIDINSTKVGAELGSEFRYGGVSLALADITRTNLFAGLASVRPLAFLESFAARSFSLGLSWTSDQKAPYRLRRGPKIGQAELGPVLVDSIETPLVETRAVNIYVLTAEVGVYASPSATLKTYAEHARLVGAGGAGSVGLLWQLALRGARLHLLKARLELRTYGARYQPSYFDVLYELQKYQMIVDPNDPNPPTKLAYVTERRGSQRTGVYVEAAYALLERLIVAVALEMDTLGKDRNLMLHGELPLSFLDLFVTYHQRSFVRPFTFDANDVLFAGARLKILPILFLNGRAQRNFAWDRARFAGLGGFAPQVTYHADVELGFQF